MFPFCFFALDFAPPLLSHYHKHNYPEHYHKDYNLILPHLAHFLKHSDPEQPTEQETLENQVEEIGQLALTWTLISHSREKYKEEEFGPVESPGMILTESYPSYEI